MFPTSSSTARRLLASNLRLLRGGVQGGLLCREKFAAATATSITSTSSSSFPMASTRRSYTYTRGLSRYISRKTDRPLDTYQIKSSQIKYDICIS